MRQAVEPPLQESLDAIEAIVDVLLHNSTDEEQILSRMATTLVQVLGYAGALILTSDDDVNLYLGAYAVQPASDLGARLQAALQAAQRNGLPALQMNQREHARSLVARALTAARPQTLQSNHLGELLYPLQPGEDAAEARATSQVSGAAAAPFFLPGELCGSLLVLSQRGIFSDRELRLLQTMARHLALGMRNARLYWRMEEQRRVAQTFAQMAFSSSAYLHTLRNQIGGLRTYLGLVKMLPHMKPEQRDEVIATGDRAMQSLDQAAEILDHLHEPWRQQPQVATDVNDCVTAALIKVFRSLSPAQREQEHFTRRGMHIQWRLAPDLPRIHTSPDMLTEAFRIVIRNAADSLHEKYGHKNPEGSHLFIESTLEGDECIVVAVRDNGIGIAPADQRRIFELGWSTKQGQGMGFGLFWTRNFVEGLGGKIAVESAAGEGATFRFTLPVSGSDSPQRRS